MATLSPEQEILQQLLGGGLSLGIIPPPNAHENMDSIIEKEEYSSILSELMQAVGSVEALGPMGGSSDETDPSILGGLIGQTDETHPDILNRQGVSKERYMHGINESELKERKTNIKKFPSFESRGVKRFTAPIMQDDGSVIKESRSMEHWLQDYDYLFNRTALSKP